MKMTHASVFSGIGGPEIAATMLGWDNAFHCEINEFGRKILEYWYPNSRSYEDITKTDFSEWRGRVDVLTGGFPCQPFSYAGQRRGADDDRYLWPHMFRCIDQVRPTWVVAENVAGILTMVEQGEVSPMESQGTLFDEGDGVRRHRLVETFTLQRICDDLDGHGYEVQPVLVPACAVGAPHRRDRVFIVARRVVADSDNDRDVRAAREDEGKSREERIQERHEVRKPDEPNQVRPEGATIPEDSLHGGQLYGQDEEQGSERNIGNTGAGGGERLRGEVSRAASSDSSSGGQPAPQQQGKRAGEKIQREDGVEPLDGAFGLSTPSTSSDTDSDGHTAQAEGFGVEGSGSGHDGESEEWVEQTEWSLRFYSILRNVADTECQRPVQSEHIGQSRLGERLPSGRGCRTLREGAVRSEDDGICGERWESFPTVSPVHRGNDGLPFPLDDLAIPASKWRTESLKAYGNAIVPQVMYEIFRAIEIVEREKL